MKASRQRKVEAQLEAAERELLALLQKVLPHTAQDGDMLFFNSDFRPSYAAPHLLGSSNERLLVLSRQSVALRERIGLPTLGSVGQLFLSACSEAANLSNDNRRGPRQLAAWLLGELAPCGPIQRPRHAPR